MRAIRFLGEWPAIMLLLHYTNLYQLLSGGWTSACSVLDSGGVTLATLTVGVAIVGLLAVFTLFA